LKEELIRAWQMETTCRMPSVLSTAGIIPNKLHDSLKLLISALLYTVHSKAERSGAYYMAYS
jgi:hypothetical protein